ncbi:MAG: hypothetical protein AMJ46_05965 [Latescibacteria bacterium DG_63]|nr:MAG: hypothetical protein AMJ46_05965 [Latescibacteria bacterium DG_63]
MGDARNIKFVLEYDGTDFHGWQIQRELRTVQGVLEESLTRLLGGPHRVAAASRTDAGAHARAQVVNTYTRSPMSPETMVRGLNALLPEDVAVKEACEVAFDFNARWNARSRRYSYKIVVGPSALWRGRAWSVRRPLALSVMKEASRVILGLKDFRAFSTSGRECENCLCAVTECEWKEWAEGYLFEIEADRFVRHMIRTLAGTMVRTGEGKMNAGEFSVALLSRVRPRLAVTAPAKGLCLEAVKYDGQ